MKKFKVGDYVTVRGNARGTIWESGVIDDINSEGAINAYWQWRSTGANNDATGNIIINYLTGVAAEIWTFKTFPIIFVISGLLI